MRACVKPIAELREPAQRQLEQNLAGLPAEFARGVMSSRPVVLGTVELIALDAVEIPRDVDLQWSPFYSGTDIYSAIAADPIPADGHCHDLLARYVRQYTRPGDDWIFPHAVASPTDSWVSQAAHEWASFEDHVFFVCRFDEDEAAWLTSFDETRRVASTVWDVGICTPRCPPRAAKWTPDSVNAMLQSATLVVASALDGDGFLVWRS